ncbi:Malonyl-CoA decarboxylase (MCD) [Variovorax sp. SRS16]|uniref:malonyl-CoA decarboxylase domain-containing protein n=1 Tax=Variovorax sp. SRS16 TaxID=282217 RepID=UPI001319579B|nr:malonyl-CoA decarboxylase family protein [Variovorax sp. SRS16]VTU19273.1 Malonyl-CoA decarboxylase (MCD) [Variovorax sp. SRS16]
MAAGDWITRGVSRLKTVGDAAVKSTAVAGIKKAGDAKTALFGDARPLAERLEATLRRPGEAMAPRTLRRALAELQAVLDPSVSDVEAGRRAHAVVQWYAGRDPGERHDVWLLMSERFAPDARKLSSARDKHEAAAGTPDEGQAEVHLRRALAAPRARLLQRFAIDPDGMRFLVDLRAELLPHLKNDRRLLPLDAELEHLFSTWFDVAFLDLRRISWDSPASLIEKLIQYEAVHDIKSWADVKNRLDSDRRCYGFFHPRLLDTPLIFVEVALVNRISEGIEPLLDEAAALVQPDKASTAIFYSISNTQTGLRGVSFGDSLIKRVVETLQGELPRLKVFATLSPIPGFRGWLAKHAGMMLAKLDEKRAAELGRVLGSLPPTAERFLSAAEEARTLDAKSPVRQLLLQSAAEYLGRATADGKPVDPVARFHLGNGARVEKLDWAGDLSTKGLKQSYGLMVNYLYDLKRLDKHRALLAQGKVAVSGDIDDLFF